MVRPGSGPEQDGPVSGSWLLKAALLVIAAALVCVYASLCLLFYQGQWQLILHPSHTVATTPASRGLRFDDIRFDVTETGASQLTGWWIPAEPSARWGTSAVLYLHDGAGSLSDTLPELVALHSLGINVFAFDYRGFGQSASLHPGEVSMSADAGAAWQYLSLTRHIPTSSIVLYGTGLGATPATALSAEMHPAGLVLDSPAATARTIIEHASFSHLLPLWLLQKDRFDPEPALHALLLPKLFVSRAADQPRTKELFEGAAAPREYVDLQHDAGYSQTLSHFLSRVLTEGPALQPDSTPKHLN